MSNGLERGLDVLELLAARGSARVADLISELDLSRATAFRLVTVLEARGYVEQVEGAHAWRLGHSVSDLAADLDSNSILHSAAPAMVDLHALSHETVNLAVLRRHQVVWAASLDGAYALRHSTTIGDLVPVHATAIGKAVLSVMPESDWGKFLPSEPYPALTPNSRRTLTLLRADVLAAREAGWALDEEESELSGVCVAAAIVGAKGQPIGAISVSSVAGRLPHHARAALGRAVQRWCDRISDELRSGKAASHPPGETTP